MLRVQASRDLPHLGSRHGRDRSLDQLVRFEARRDLHARTSKADGNISTPLRFSKSWSSRTRRTRPSPLLISTEPLTVSPRR